MFQLTLISFFNHVLPIYVIFLASYFPDLEQLWTDSWMPAISMLGNLFVYMTTSTRFFFLHQMSINTHTIPGYFIAE